MIGHPFDDRYPLTEVELRQRELRAIADEVRRTRRATKRKQVRRQVRRQLGELLMSAGAALVRETA
jgi:hypothetical protein